MYNSRMIELAREVRGMTQSELSKQLTGIPQSLLCNYENGKYETPQAAIEQIAKALNFPTSFFKKQKSLTRISKFYYRKRSAFPAKQIGPLEAKIDVMRTVYHEFLKSVRFNYREIPKLSVNEKNTPNTIAKLLRMFFDLDEGPIDNLIEVIENAGIPIVFLDVESDKFSGMTVQTSNNFPMIFVNKNMPNDHIKFTLCHELGHIVMHIPFVDDEDFYEGLQEDSDVIEKQANQFAGAFLIPEVGAKKTFRPITYGRLSDLKMYWKVSKQSIINRAKDLCIIDDIKYRNLYIELSRNGERKNEKLTVSLDKPTLLKKIVEMHEKQMNKTREEICEDIASLSVEDFNTWFDLNEQVKLRFIKPIR